MENCAACQQRHYSEVNFCPFCGEASSAVDGNGRRVVAHSRSDGPPALMLALAEPAALPESWPAMADSMGLSVSGREMGTVDSLATGGRPALAQNTATAEKPLPPRLSELDSDIDEGIQGRPKPKNRWILPTLGVFAVVGALGYFWIKQNRNELECTQAFKLGSEHVEKGDLAAAREQSGKVDTVCIGRLEAKAKTLQKNIASAERDCQVRINTMSSKLGEHHLTSARSYLHKMDKLANKCFADKVVPLRKKLDMDQKLADALQRDLRKMLDANSFENSKIMFGQLERLNSEQPDLNTLKAELTLMREMSKQERKEPKPHSRK